MKKNTVQEMKSGEELFQEVKKLCEKEGMQGWKLAQEAMLKEKPTVKGLRDIIEYAMCQYQPDYFRPALLSFCCKAAGGNPKPTIPTGAALTLLAWAIGIHDDIIDRSKTKSGRLTIFGKFGEDYALILSDILLFKGFTLLRQILDSGVPVKRYGEMLETMENIWFEQSIGEMLEVQHRGLTKVTLGECLEKVRMRASEIEACARVGAILGGGSKGQVENVGRYGRLVGMMGILRNELIDMLELNALRHRIRRESAPLPLVYALQDSKMKRQLLNIIVESKLARKDLKTIAKLSNASGGMDYAVMLVDKMSEEARSIAKAFKSKELGSIASCFRLSPKDWKLPLSD